MITPQILRSWNACWSDERIAALFAGRPSLTAREVGEDATISFDDRIWALTRTLDHAKGRAALVAFAESCWKRAGRSDVAAADDVARAAAAGWSATYAAAAAAAAARYAAYAADAAADAAYAADAAADAAAYAAAAAASRLESIADLVARIEAA